MAFQDGTTLSSSMVKSVYSDVLPAALTLAQRALAAAAILARAAALILRFFFVAGLAVGLVFLSFAQRAFCAAAIFARAAALNFDFLGA